MHKYVVIGLSVGWLVADVAHLHRRRQHPWIYRRRTSGSAGTSSL